MKKLLCTIAALLALLALSSCSGNGGGTDTSAGTQTEAETKPSEEIMTPEEAKIEALRILTPAKSSSDYSFYSDGVIYDECETSHNGILSTPLRFKDLVTDGLYVPDKPNEELGAFLKYNYRRYIWRFADGDEPESLCRNKNCRHDDIRCPSVMMGMLFVLTDEKTGDTVVYYQSCIPLGSVRIDGQSVNMENELKNHLPPKVPNYYGGEMIYPLFEYNMTTGERRTVSLDFPKRGAKQIYYNGRIYAEPLRHLQSGTDSVMASIDVTTGEIAYFGGENLMDAYSAQFAGIYEEAVYAFIRSENKLVKISPDFSEYEEVCVMPDNFVGSTYEFSDGFLYTRFRSDTEYGNYLSDFYKYDLSGKISPELITENVDDTFRVGNYIYFGRNFVEGNATDWAMHSESSLYRYDITSGRIETVFTLDGIEVSYIKYADGDRIIYGAKVRTEKPDIIGMPENPDMIATLLDSELSIYVEYTFETGEHRFVYFSEEYTPHLTEEIINGK